MPTVAAGKVMNEIEKESDFRKIATVIRAYKTDIESLQRTGRIGRNL